MFNDILLIFPASGAKTKPFSQMWDEMVDFEPSVFEKTKGGIDRVSEAAGKYAYFMESSTIEYVVERRCDLTQVCVLT